MFDDDEDDLGDPHGSVVLPGAELARRAVQQWQLIEVGRRPRDYMGRDLLISSWQRDGRQRLFRKLSKQPPQWIGRLLPTGLDDDLRQTGLHVLVMQFVQSVHLVSIREHAAPEYLRTINRALNCWPYGAMFEFRGRGRRTGEKVCGKARQCPFCMARAVTKLFDALSDRLGPNVGDRPLVRLRVCVGDELFHRNPGHSLRKHWRQIRDRVTKALIRELHLLGVDGGLTTFLVGPKRGIVWPNGDCNDEPTGFEFFFSAVGEITRCTSHFLNLRETPWTLTVATNQGYLVLDGDCGIFSGSESLRRALVGTSIAYARDGLENIVGAFQVPSWNLSRADQWQAHVIATRGMKLFSPFGTWLNSNGAPRTPTRRASQRGATDPRSLDHINASRHQTASSRRRDLLREVEQMLNAEPQLRELGRQKFRLALNAGGCDVSDRDARYLLKAIRNPFRNLEYV